MLSQCSIEKSKIHYFDFHYLTQLLFRKGYINTEDLKEVFSLLGENVSDDEVNSKKYNSL